MALTGLSLIGRNSARPGSGGFQAHDRLNGDPLDPIFYECNGTDVDAAVELAARAFREYADISTNSRSAFLELIAQKLEARRDELVTRAYHETGLPVARLNGELTRTCSQFQFFASILRHGKHLDVRIDTANPDREPSPMPEIRSMMHPLGPIVVFGAANFPFAFSVAGGDTASALAAGCTVIAKSHPSHPGVSELAGLAIQEATEELDLPEGVFSMLHLTHEQASDLLEHVEIAAGGFTGSRSAGMSLFQRAANRTKPIPFYAEMSSINPVVALPGIIEGRAESFAKALAASITLGVGQFCTNPGLIFAVGDSEAFVASLRSALEHVGPGLMLSETIGESYLAGCKEISSVTGISALLRPSASGAAGLFSTDLSTFASNRKLQQEVFGPATLVVRCRDIQEAMSGIQTLEGQLTASLHLVDDEIPTATHLFAQMEKIAGRLIVNGFPTGVEVCESMVHGGPFPATTDGRSTSVGGRAILRWMRPVCYQDVPEELLPAELRPPPYS